MTVVIGRRKFLVALGGVVVAWPRVAGGQQADKVRLIGVLIGSAPKVPEIQNRLTAFLTTLQGLGWTEGRNARIEVRWMGTELDRGKGYAAELVALAPEVIFCAPTPALAEMSRLTRNIPIVFANVSDPMGSGGFVSRLDRPGGNITGFSNFEPTMGGKWLQLLKEIAPSVSRVTALVDPNSPINLPMARDVEGSGASLGVKVSAASIRDANDIEQAIATLAGQAGGGLIVLVNPVTQDHYGLIIALAERHRLPAIYPYRSFAVSGGLISYGIDQADQWRGAAGYVDRILRGEKAGDLPVQAPTKFDLVINVKTAKALGLTAPPRLLALADEVVE
jgi:putative tryptophan/tyrosine transport system substrate-binding protein